MAVTVDSVIVELEAKIDRYNADVNAAHANFSSKMTAIEAAGFKMGSGLRSSFGFAAKAAAGFAAALSVQAIVNVTKAGLDYAASLGEVAQSLGVTTGFLQEFRFAATQNGASVESADNALGKFSVTLGNAFEKSGQARDAITGLGLDLNTLAKASDSERYARVADAIAKIKDPAQQSAAAIAIFGRGARDIIPTLQLGAEGFRRQAAEARAYGLVLSNSQIQNADKVADKIDALNRALSARIAGVIADNANAIGALANALANVAEYALRATKNYAGFFANVSARGLIPALTDSIEAPSGRFSGERGGVALNAKRSADLYRQAAAALRRGDQKKADSLKQDAGIARTLALAGRQEIIDRNKANQAGIGGVGVIKSGGGGGGGKSAGGSSGPSLAELAARFNEDLLRAQGDVLSALEQMAVGIVDQSALQRERLENDRKAAVTQIEGNKDYTAAQKATLVAEVNKRAAIDADAINRRENEQLAREAVQITQAALANDTDALQRALGMARSTSERRDIELRLLDLAYQREKAELEGVIASKTSTDAEKKIAAARLAKLGSLQAGDAANIERQNAGPLKSYLDGIPQTAAEVSDALEAIAANGLKSLNDGIADAIVNGKDLGSVFKSVASSIISDLIRIAVQQAIIKPLGGLLGGLFGGGIGNIFGGLGGGIGGGRASGGDVVAGKMYRVNETGIEGFQSAASGKIIPLGRMPKASSGGAGGGTSLTVVVNANDAVLADTVRGWVADGVSIASAQGAIGGAELAKRNNARRGQRTLGRGGR